MQLVFPNIVKIVFAAFTLMAIGRCCGAQNSASAPLPRIGIRSGRFVDTQTGKPLLLRGFNYIRLRPNPQSVEYPLHDLLNPKRYVGDMVESALTDLHNAGYNVVRVFIDPAAVSGIAASGGDEEFSSTYMRNVYDMLERARKHKVYVYFNLSYTPDSEKYHTIVGQLPAHMFWANALYLYPPVVKAKTAYLKAFVYAITSYDPGLLSTVFAYEAENEANLISDQEPLSSKSKFTFSGRTFDLNASEGVQALADFSALNWANSCAEAVHITDPQALVSASVYTFAAVGRSGPGRAWLDNSADPRIPMDASVFAKSKLSFIDIHLYPIYADSLDKDLLSLDWPNLKKTCADTGKPLIMGEFGLPTSDPMTTVETATYLKKHAQRVLDLGFQGYLMWHYDCVEDKTFHNAREADDQIFHALMNLAPRPVVYK